MTDCGRRSGMGTGIPLIEFPEAALMTKMFGAALLASVLAASVAAGQSAPNPRMPAYAIDSVRF